MGRTVPELLDTTTGRDLAEWWALYELRADEAQAEHDAMEREMERARKASERTHDTVLGRKSDGGSGRAVSADEWVESLA